MKKVCHMTSAHVAEDDRIFLREARSLAAQQYEVFVVARGTSYDKAGIHIIGCGQPSSGSRLFRAFSFSKRVYECALAINADLYHIHDPELLPYGLKLKKKGKKVIFDSHELYVEQFRSKPYLPGWVSFLLSTAYGYYEKYVLRRIDALIFPCLRDGRHPFEGQCRRVITIANFSRLEELYDHYDLNVPKNPNSIVHIGSLTYERGITHMIKASHMSGAISYLGGQFSPASYEMELKAMPEYPCVNYLGILNREQVRETLQTSLIGMATLLNVGQYNKYDTLATKTFEYMAMGIPTILSHSPYNAAMVEKYQFGICVDPENANEIAGAIRYLLENPEEAKRMGENGRRAVKEEFNWGVEEKKLLALYEDILNN